MGYLDTVRAVRTGDLKLIEYATDTGRSTQLFDLASDPWEGRNLAGEPAHAATVDTMRARLAAARDAQGDPKSPFEQRFWARAVR